MSPPRQMADRVQISVYVDSTTAEAIDANAAAMGLVHNGKPNRSALMRWWAEGLPLALDCPDCRCPRAYTGNDEKHYGGCPRMEEN